jgi:hypothetical protein
MSEWMGRWIDGEAGREEKGERIDGWMDDRQIIHLDIFLECRSEHSSIYSFTVF